LPSLSSLLICELWICIFSGFIWALLYKVKSWNNNLAALTNISWTLKPVLADDSIKYSIPYSSLNFSASSFCITLDSSKSALFPIKNIFVSGDELCLKSFIHNSILSKLALLFS